MEHKLRKLLRVDAANIEPPNCGSCPNGVMPLSGGRFCSGGGYGGPRGRLVKNDE